MAEVISVPSAAVRTRQRSAPRRRPGDRSGERRSAGPPLAGTAPRSRVAVLGYASVSGPAGSVKSEELKRQADVIARECERRGLALLELVGEREPQNGRALERPGLSYALERIAAREAQGLVVSDLSRLTHSAADLGSIIEWFTSARARLVAVAHALDTEDEAGRLAANMLVEVSGWERERLSERTRQGLKAARLNGRGGGRPAVTDDPGLRDRILRMRAHGMTLQAIADTLNAEGVPTLRGGAKWRHSSVQTAAGYKRPTKRSARDRLPAPDPPGPKHETDNPDERGEPWAR
jgi:DNA invertase Pin-like site-specific DNA recombinase